MPCSRSGEGWSEHSCNRRIWFSRTARAPRTRRESTEQGDGLVETKRVQPPRFFECEAVSAEPETNRDLQLCGTCWRGALRVRRAGRCPSGQCADGVKSLSRSGRVLSVRARGESALQLQLSRRHASVC